MISKKNIVVIGGGTGTFNVLTGLKTYPVNLTAIVSMTDSGGSNRILRDEFGLLPTSDLRQAMVALASDDGEQLLRKLFSYRYSQGVGISGMTFGNLFMAALTDILGSQAKAIQETCDILDVRGRVLPVTYDNSQLVARYDHGKQVLGEHHIDEPDTETGAHRLVELEVFPKATANPDALEVLASADYIILGPGDLFTSVICNLVVDGIAKAIRKSKAKKIFVINLMTKFGQTNGFSASDHLFEISKYLDGGVIDHVLISSSFKLNKGLLKRYAEEKAEIVIDDLDKCDQFPKPNIVRANIVSKQIIEKSKSDTLKRSLIRHDPAKLAKALVSIF